MEFDTNAICPKCGKKVRLLTNVYQKFRQGMTEEVRLKCIARCGYEEEWLEF